MQIPECLLIAFAPASESLLEVTRRAMDDSMLREIAAADYGIDTDRHLERLRIIRDEGRVAGIGGWHPWEVLELIRWSNPDDPRRKPGATGVRGHRMRAFACAALLRIAAEPDSNCVSEEATLAQAISSARVLGPEVSLAAARFLTWWLQRIEFPDRWLIAWGLAALAVRLRDSRLTDEQLREVAAWFLEEEGAARRQAFPFDFPEHPPQAFGATQGLWQPLGQELVQSSASIRTQSVRSDLELIGALLAE